ncbi:MAG: hypothetical protein H0W18_19185 [Acidobacteria bacterium]|nr:hypothetical protein [Acidobacteriota bacterium]
MRTLVGAVGYRNLRDHSAPFAIIDRLSSDDLGPDVVVEDTSYNPIAIVQWLEGETPENRFDRVVLVAAIERSRAPGAITAYRWDGVLPPDEQVQQAVVEAVTGVIALENTVVIAGYFHVLPLAVAIVEIEPVDHAFGADFSPVVSAAIEPACVLIRRLARDPDVFGTLPVRPMPFRHAVRLQT